MGGYIARPSSLGGDFMNLYERMKPKIQKGFTERMHWFDLFHILLSRTEWEGLPDTIPEEYLKGFAIINGTVGVGECNGSLWCFDGSYHGDVIGYLPNKYQGALPNMNFDGFVGKDIVVGWNNATRTPEFSLMKYSSILTEIDVSEKVNVLFSRFMRIPKASDEKDKAAIVQTIKNIADGKFDAVVSSNIQSDARELIGDTTVTEPFIDLTDVDKVDKLQYLNQYRENVMKRFWATYGQKSSVGSKLAQMSTTEVEVGDSIPIIGLNSWLHYQKKLSEDLNRVFGLNTSVKLSKAWADEVEEMKQQEGVNENADETDEDSNDASDSNTDE